MQEKTSSVMLQGPLTKPPVHPLESAAHVLLTSVFGPYAQDDEYGSRKINPMELYHNQVTRVQGPFSLRMFHRSWGLMMIQANISAPCHLLDFPTLDRFIKQIRRFRYDIVGISSIQSNVAKVKKMCELIRHYRPQCTIVVGGHISNLNNLKHLLDADFIVQGDGIRWFREYLGENTEYPVNHPLIFSGIGGRALGMPLDDKPKSTAATLIPAVGCPLGCNFCSTSAMFGGKGKYINFYKTGYELYEIMQELEHRMKIQSFFVMDENFLLNRKRALELLDLMEKHDKSWSLYVFSSANVILKYKIEELVRLGISWVWMGIEGENAPYKKLKGIDTFSLISALKAHGIRILGSSIIGLENHTPENIDSVINYAVAHNSDFHQFMLYTPTAGTPLFEEMKQRNLLLSQENFNQADVHGQLRFNYKHPHIPEGEEENILLSAFQRDFEANGPSIVRMIRTTFQGWLKYRFHPDLRIRKRYCRESKGLGTTFAAALWATERWFREKQNLPLVRKIDELRQEINQAFGLKARTFGPMVGRIILRQLRREERRILRGFRYEPPTFYDINFGRNPTTKKLFRQRLIGQCLWVQLEPRRLLAYRLVT